ncbi:uncharacterized protein LOC123297389 isoform X2 [Chrysoperla carnea]|uniref:uncharacterized protein LOC123297389 isoform X2 n=1 Tax=Chrysoperla carnea TaxID=189513 RepID=UPI001D06723C|nr:uncharacterized protein LOC123297389 isoform X2 [Chrysoperla carnea]
MHYLWPQWQLGPVARVYNRVLSTFIYVFLLYGLGNVLFDYGKVSAIPTSASDFNNNTNNNASSTEFPDLEDRGDKKFGDKCEHTKECGFMWGVCDPGIHSCQCYSEYPVTNHIDKCGKASTVNESCYFNEQCEATSFQTECRDSRCVCKFEMTPFFHKDGRFECLAVNEPLPDKTYVDPAMIGVLCAMAVMFIIICVVLRLFANARWRENRSIFNTPNPRLMNVSLLRDSKLLHGERRGSRASVRGPSRQPSMASLRPHSPNSQGSRPGSRGSSNASVTSVRSNKSPTGVAPQPHHQHTHHHSHPPNTNTPMLESVTVDIQAPKA